MTALADLIKAQIRATGPLSLADYMSLCLSHPRHGYYMTRDPLGKAGDFTTAPEISQMFGELIGLCLAQTWLDQGAPSPFLLVELGPGRGTLMTDILRATAQVAGFHDAARLHLVETSKPLRAHQAARLPKAQWSAHIEDLPSGPIFGVANEFFDALPIRQFQRCGAQWRECQIGLHEDMLTLGLSEPVPLPELAHRLADTADGDIVETCAAAQQITNRIGARIANEGGAMLIIDYGGWRSLGDTFQAVQDHASVDPLARPGQADLTAHVDFEALAHAATPARHTQITEQGLFLHRLGIAARTQTLAQNLQGTALETHLGAYRRLTDQAEMGSVFKVLGLYPHKAMPPPGLDP